MQVPYVAAVLAELARRPHPEPAFLHLGDYEGAPADPSEGAFRRAQLRLTERVLEAAAVSDGMHVLEVGCGLGANLAVLDARVAGASLLGTDVGPAQIAWARVNVAPSGRNALAWREADALALPAAAASQDRVLAVECAFHFADRAAFAREAARLLRPGGRLVLTDFVADGAPPPDLPPGLERALREDLAPYPDPFCARGAWRAPPGPLRPLRGDDLTAAVLPSFDYIFAGKEGRWDGPHAADRGAAALAWLLRRGHLRVELHVLERGPA